MLKHMIAPNYDAMHICGLCHIPCCHCTDILLQPTLWHLLCWSGVAQGQGLAQLGTCSRQSLGCWAKPWKSLSCCFPLLSESSEWEGLGGTGVGERQKA